jgi:transcription antitermination factor NusG
LSWYALYTRPRHEKKAAELLIEKDFVVYLPLIQRVRQWKDRKKKVDMPLFNSYLFVNFEYNQRFEVLKTHGVVKIINFSGQPAVVPDWQIDSLKRMLDFPDTVRLEKYITPGEIVEIKQGPMRGLKGMVNLKKDSKRLVLSIDGVFQSISVEIEEEYVERIQI